MIYTVTVDQERVDVIARKLYGSERGGTLERLLAANPGTATEGPFLPRGTVLTVPPAPEPEPNAAYQRIWE